MQHVWFQMNGVLVVSEVMGRVAKIAPLVTVLVLGALLAVFLLGVRGGLSQAGAAQPAEPWVPTVEYSRGANQAGYPLPLTLWPPAMSGQQPLRSLAIQFDVPYASNGGMRLSVKNADGSSSEIPFSSDGVHDNDYVTFPMNGKIPVSAELSSLGGGPLWPIEVKSPDGTLAT